ncbi:MAG TPA: hypothetical protein VFK41_12495 [Nocardioidaceae bacterium]|nr:hypothetical protein [Nocardioidaceae bacterium]
MQTRNRRTLATVLSLATAASLCLVPAGAGAEESARAARACSALVTAIDAQQRVRQLAVESAAITTDRASAPLKFKGYQQGVVAAKDTDTGTVLWTRVVTRDGRPRTLEIRSKDSDTENLTTSATPFAQDGFEPKLFTTSFKGAEAFSFAGGTLARWTTYRRSNGSGLYFGSRVALKSGLRLKTLTYAFRAKIGGVPTDVLFATTGGGALLAAHVPVRKPANARVKVVKRKGFRRYTGLSTAQCGNAFGILFIDKGDLAHMFSITHPMNPSAGDVTREYRVAPDFGWSLTATV